MRRDERGGRVVAAALVAVVATGCVERTRAAADPMAARAAPDSFVVAFETSKGEFTVKARRGWSPAAVDRLYHLAERGFWEGARFYRVNPRYAQFGYSGRPEADAEWVGAGLPDEPTRASNVRGAVSFARGGPGSRSAILFVNKGDNSNLDELQWNGVTGFPPIGEVVSGMEVVDALEEGYEDQPLQWEDSIAARGNAFLDRRYPGLDSIVAIRIVEDW